MAVKASAAIGVLALGGRCVAAGGVIDMQEVPLFSAEFMRIPLLRRRRACPARPAGARLLTGIAVLALATAVTPALGQDAQAQGRTLFNEGVALYNKGDFEAACPKLEASLKAYAGIGTRGKLAECYEKIGRYASAYAAYREVAQLATRGGDPAREQVASERAKSLEAKLSYVTVTLPAANDVPGLVIKRNGRELDRSKLGSAEPVDSGNVTIDVSAPGRKTFNGHVAVMQGLSVRFEVPSLVADAPVVPVTPRPSPDRLAPPPPPSPVTDEVAPIVYGGDPPSWQKPLGLVLVGVGVVGVGVGGYFGLAAKSKYNSAFDGGNCDRATKACDPFGQSAIHDARSKATVSTILFGAGAGLAVVGAVVFFTAPSSRSHALQIAPTTYAGGAGLTVRGLL
jgi:hypothetical protein